MGGNSSSKKSFDLEPGKEGHAKVEEKKVPKGWIIGKTDKITKYYKLGKQIGQPGAYGYAVLATRKSDRKEFAVKVIKKKNIQPSSFGTLRAELSVMRALSHPNIIDGYEAYENKAKLFLVMEACKGGELFDHILEETESHITSTGGGYSERDAARILTQIFEGLHYLHEHKIAHCDLKPDNFLMVNRSKNSPVKIIDFGMSKFAKKGLRFEELCGTPNYMAPEVFKKQYTYYCDMWSMGVVMFAMLFGFFPFNEPDEKKLQACIQNGFYKKVAPGKGPWFPSAIPVSAAARDLLGRLMEQDPIARITAEEVLAHPWLHGEAPTVPLVGHVLSNMVQLTAGSKMRTMLLTAVCDQTFSAEEVKSLRAAFNAMDTDGNGLLTMSEIKEVIVRSEGTESKNVQAVAALLEIGDVDGDGELSYEELLLAATQRKLTAKEDRLHDMFDQLDANHDGVLTAEEITEALGHEVEGLAEMIAEVDIDGNNQLDYHEFVEIFMHHTKDSW